MTAPQLRCRKCGAPLERDTSVKRPFYHCTNLNCLARPKPGLYIGGVLVVGKGKGDK